MAALLSLEPEIAECVVEVVFERAGRPVPKRMEKTDSLVATTGEAPAVAASQTQAKMRQDVEVILHHWRRVIANCPSGWDRSFALSIMKQSQRGGWMPTPKQYEQMCRMVDDLRDASNSPELLLIEDREH
jgi:hypothetical protein